MRRGLFLALALLCLGCWGRGEPDLTGGAGGDAALLGRIVGDFYGRLENRRFDSIATYEDPALREFFHSHEAFADYYADLALVLTDARFEAKRPTQIVLREISFETPARAHVTIRLTGENGLPMRFWKTRVTREDLWERSYGRWWIIPGKL